MFGSYSTIDLHLPEGRELVRTLLAVGADPTAQDDPHCRTALHTAAMIDDVELVKVKAVWWLVFPYTYLLFLLTIDNMTCLCYLFNQIILEAGVDVNIRNAQNTTPLHVALNRGANSCVGLLLAAGANCNIQVCCLADLFSFNFVDSTGVCVGCVCKALWDSSSYLAVICSSPAYLRKKKIALGNFGSQVQ